MADTGLVRAVAGGWHLLADIGPPCPPSLPGHAHADTFGCLVHVDGVPLLVDTGTSTYEPGPVRRYERSTAAHSTLQVDGADSTEVWGVFRAARRARVRGLAVRPDPSGLNCRGGTRRIPAAARPPPPSPPLVAHRRRDAGRRPDYRAGTARDCRPLAACGRLGGAAHRGTAQVTGRAGAFRVAIDATGPVLLAAQSGGVAAGFGRTADAPVLTCRIDAWLRPGSALSGLVLVAARAERIRHETGRPAGQRRPRRGARCSPSGDQPGRGSGSHCGLGDLRGDRTSGHRARQVQPACEGAGPARPGPPGSAEGADRGHPGHGAGGQGRAACTAPRLLRGRCGHRGRRRRRRDRVGRLVAAGGTSKANHAEFQAVPVLALRGRAGRGTARTRRSPPSRPSRCTRFAYLGSGRAPRLWCSALG